MPDDSAPQDPRLRMAELFEQLRHRGAEPQDSARVDPAGEMSPPEAPGADVIAMEPAHPPADIAAHERRLFELEQRVSARLEELATRQRAAESEPAAPSDNQRTEEWSARLAELDRRLAEVAKVEQDLALQLRGLSAPVVPAPAPAPAPVPAPAIQFDRRLWIVGPAVVLAVIVVVLGLAWLLSRRGIERTPARNPSPVGQATSTSFSVTPAARSLPLFAPTASPVPIRAVESSSVSVGALPTLPTAAPTATIVSNIAPPATAPPDPKRPLAVVATFAVGQALCDLAVDDAGQHLYLTDDGPERLLVLDPATGKQTAQFELHDSVCSIALDEQGQMVYAPAWHRAGPGRYDGSAVLAVHLPTGATTVLPDDQFPSGPSFDAKSRILYVGNTAQPNLLSLDGRTGATATLAVAAKVNRVGVSSTTGRLYLTSPEDNKVVVYDKRTGQVVATLSVGQRPWGVAVDPQSGAVLVSSELSGSVSLLDPATNQVVRTTPTGSHPRQVAVDGVHGRFYALNVGDRTVSVLAVDGSLLSTSAPLPGSEELTGLAVAGQAGAAFVVSKTHVYVLR